MIKPYLSTLLFSPGFSCILPFYPAIIATFASGKTSLIIGIIMSTNSKVAQLPDIVWNASFSHDRHIQISTYLSPQLGNNSDEYRGKERITEMGQEEKTCRLSTISDEWQVTDFFTGAPVKKTNIHANWDIAYTSKVYSLIV